MTEDGMESLFRAHLLTTGKSNETAKSYVANVRIFQRWSASHVLDPGNADRRDVERYLAAEFSRLARNTVAARLAALRCYFEYLGRPEVCAGLKVKREKLAPRRPYSEAEVAALMAAARNDTDRAMMTVALECGLRVSELVGMRREDIDGDTVVVRGKGGKQRRVVLSAKAQECLGVGLNLAGGLTVPKLGPIWPVSVVQAKHSLARCGERAGVHAHWHRYRTTFASRFLARTGNLDALRVIMGHSSAVTTAAYGSFEAEARSLSVMRGLGA